MQDWIMSSLTLSMIGVVFVFGVKVIRAHSKWMDTIAEITVFDSEFEKVWKPEILTHSKEIAVLKSNQTLVLEILARIENKIDRRSGWRSSTDETKRDAG